MISNMGPSAAPDAAVRCNIGAAEIGRRRRMAIVLTVGGAVVAVILIGLAVPHLARLLLWPIAAAASVTWLQVTQRFCVAFGAAGLENFGPLGSEHRVGSEQAAADRRRALQLTLQGALVGLIVAVGLVIVPV
jgi:predicted metal-binding membrane protein